MISRELVTRMAGAQRVVALTGAGISAESGIPTFRDAGGLWAKYRAEDLASPEGFARDPQFVWSWYQMRRKAVQVAKPNAGHWALAQMARCIEQFTVVTQNVDGLHQAAGSTAVLELHGNILRSHCHGCSKACEDGGELLSVEQVPRCVCGGFVRPSVVWFGESLPEEVFEAARRAVRSAEVVLSIGTSAAVFPAAELAYLAKHKGAWVVEINPEITPLTCDADESYRASASEALGELARLMG